MTGRRSTPRPDPRTISPHVALVASLAFLGLAACGGGGDAPSVGDVDGSGDRGGDLRVEQERLTSTGPGLELEVHVAGGKEILSEVRVDGEGHATSEGLAVGVLRERVEELLGEPREREAGEWTFALREGDPDPNPTMLHVAFDGGRVASLRWVYYVD